MNNKNIKETEDFTCLFRFWDFHSFNSPAVRPIRAVNKQIKFTDLDKHHQQVLRRCEGGREYDQLRKNPSEIVKICSDEIWIGDWIYIQIFWSFISSPINMFLCSGYRWNHTLWLAKVLHLTFCRSAADQRTNSTYFQNYLKRSEPPRNRWNPPGPRSDTRFDKGLSIDIRGVDFCFRPTSDLLWPRWLKSELVLPSSD